LTLGVFCFDVAQHVHRKFAVVFGDRLVFYDDETRSNVKDRCDV
jgi:hypothetical protein